MMSFRNRLRSERGTTLIETMLACGILVVVMGGLMGLAGVALGTTENQGHLSARETEYAVDKMEQLLELTYGDTQSDTTVFPSTNSGGTGLALGGSVSTAAPATGYTDYLDVDGTILCTAATPCTSTPPSNWYYMRVWQITAATATLKRVTVKAAVKSGFGNAAIATSTITAFKTNCPAGC